MCSFCSSVSHFIQQDNQLAAAYLVLLNRLSNERVADLALENVDYDVPMLDGEHDEVEQQIYDRPLKSS